MTDWADDEAERISAKEVHDREVGNDVVLERDIAAALRAAELRGRVAGMREAADYFHNQGCLTVDESTQRYYDAEAIRKRASKLSPTT